MDCRTRAQWFVNEYDRLARVDAQSPYGERDVRRAVFNNLAGAVRASVLDLNIASAVEERRIGGPALESLFGCNAAQVQLVFDSWLKYNRLAFVTMFQFQVENALKNTLAALRDDAPPSGYYRIARDLLEELALNCSDRLNRLNVLAQIRNTYHSNGIHTQRPFSVAIDDTSFRFETGQNVSCATWRHIYLATHSSVSILLEVMEHDLVRALKHVPDQYAP